MEQYISKSALVTEIERLLAFYLKEIEGNKEDPWAMDIAKRDILQEILSFLDTLEAKEPQVKESAEIERDKETCKENGNSLTQEPVSEDLEIAANEWDAKASFTPFYMALDDKGNPDGVRQDYTTHADSFKAGAKWQKEHMMAKAIEMIVGYWMSNGLMLTVDETENCYNIDEGDKVKVIVIKED